MSFDKYKKRGAYHHKEMSWNPWKRKLPLIARYFSVLKEIPKNSFVFDLGCGDGAFLKLCVKKKIPGIGIDVNKDAIRLAKQMVHEQFFYNYDLHNINSERLKELVRISYEEKLEKRTPVLVMIEVVEHVEGIREIMQNLKLEGCRVIITTPNATCPYWGVPVDQIDKFKVEIFTPETILELFEGFDRVQVKPGPLPRWENKRGRIFVRTLSLFAKWLVFKTPKEINHAKHLLVVADLDSQPKIQE